MKIPGQRRIKRFTRRATRAAKTVFKRRKQHRKKVPQIARRVEFRAIRLELLRRCPKWILQLFQWLLQCRAFKGFLNTLPDTEHSDVPEQTEILLNATHSRFIRARQTLRSFRVTFLDVSMTVLRIVNESASVFSPLRSAAGLTLACLDVKRQAKSSKSRARQLKEEIVGVIDSEVFDSKDLSCLHSTLLQLHEISNQPFRKRLIHLNRNEEVLAIAKA
ncbi:hypothetical protein VKT23_009007 [Stygiomarasmius scandens]|uniref:Uncharacterized protein n=1 Tax=Marasmiellus scandens TaxID=2682957 RepID=A0ABR1JG55_9AGAR